MVQAPFGEPWNWCQSEVIAAVNGFDLDPDYLVTFKPDQMAKALSCLAKLGDCGLNRLANRWPSPFNSRQGLSLLILGEALHGGCTKPGRFFVPGKHEMASLPFVFCGGGSVPAVGPNQPSMSKRGGMRCGIIRRKGPGDRCTPDGMVILRSPRGHVEMHW
jgi:hypothetical protein